MKLFELINRILNSGPSWNTMSGEEILPIRNILLTFYVIQVIMALWNLAFPSNESLFFSPFKKKTDFWFAVFPLTIPIGLVYVIGCFFYGVTILSIALFKDIFKGYKELSKIPKIHTGDSIALKYQKELKEASEDFKKITF